MEHDLELRSEHIRVGVRVGGEAIQLAGQECVLLVHGEVSQQNLPTRRSVQRGQLSDPVLARYRGRPLRLHHVDRKMLTQHGHVDGLAQRPGDLVGQGPRLLRQIELHVDSPSQPHHTKPQTVLTAVPGLLDQLSSLQGAQETEGGGLVHTDLIRDLTNPGQAPFREQLEDVQCAVNRLQTAAGLRSGDGHGSPSVAASFEMSDVTIVRVGTGFTRAACDVVEA